MRKKIVCIIAVLCLSAPLVAQQPLRMADGHDGIGGSITTLNQQGVVNGQGVGRDSTVVDRGVPRDVNMFAIDPTLGSIIPVDTDTAIYNFQNLHPAYS